MARFLKCALTTIGAEAISLEFLAQKPTVTDSSKTLCTIRVVRDLRFLRPLRQIPSELAQVEMHPL